MSFRKGPEFWQADFIVYILERNLYRHAYKNVFIATFHNIRVKQRAFFKLHNRYVIGNVPGKSRVIQVVENGPGVYRPFAADRSPLRVGAHAFRTESAGRKAIVTTILAALQ